MLSKSRSLDSHGYHDNEPEYNYKMNETIVTDDCVMSGDGVKTKVNIPYNINKLNIHSLYIFL